MKNRAVILSIVSLLTAAPARAKADPTGVLLAGAVLACAALLVGATAAETRRSRREFEAEKKRFKDKHDSAAAALGKKHIGFGIYFEGEIFLQAFSEADRRFLRDPQSDRLAVAKFLCEQLSGDYDETKRSEDYEDGVDAVLFLKGQSGLRGVCRHKAAVLVAALNFLGINAEVALSNLHAWVVLPDLQLALDPTSNDVQPAKNYRNHQFDCELADTLCRGGVL